MIDIDKIFDYVLEVRLCEKNLSNLKLEDKKCCEDMYIIQNEYSYVCANCGVVNNCSILADQVFSENYLPSKVSDLYPDSSMGTIISGSTKLAKIQNWNRMTYKERVIWQVSNDLNSRLSGKYPDNLILDTLNLYKDLYNRTDIKRGKNKSGLIATCLYFASKKNNMSLSPKQISNLMGIEVSVINKCISTYMMENLTITENDPSEYLQVYFNKFSIDFKIQKLIKKLSDFLKKEDFFEGNVPQSIALSCFVFIMKEINSETDVKSICSFANISFNTLSKMIKKLEQNKQYIFSRLK